MVLLCHGLVVVSSFSFSCELSLGLSSDFSPYHKKTVDKEWVGISVDLASTLVNLAGCQLHIIELPWARSLRLLESGDIQLISHFTFTQERAKFTEYLGPHHIEKIAFVVKNDFAKDVTTPAELSHFNGKIGLTRGDNYGEEFDRYVLKNPLVEPKLIDIRNNQDRIAMLIRGRLDAIFYDEMSAITILAAKETLKNNYSVRFTLQGNPVYWGISKHHVSHEVKSALNQAWGFMLQNQMIEPIYQKYGLSVDMQQLAHYPLKLLNEGI